ncbi:hypothetical protein BDQ17DRAFT_1259576, partial [Cyathus striatus]
EIKFLWMRPKGPRTFWFLLNRYFSFFGNLVEIIVNFITIPETLLSCEAYNLFRQLFIGLNQIIVCVLLALRIYALYSHSFRILVCMACSAAAVLIVGIVRFISMPTSIYCLYTFRWSLFGQKYFASQPLAGTGCHIGLTRETAIHIASAWEALMVYETMVFSFILYRTWTTRGYHDVTRIHVPLISLILKDISIFFDSAIALANLSNILTFYPFLRGALSTFASSISVTMMSRIMLNLHQNAGAGMYSTAQTTSTMQYSDSTYSEGEEADHVELYTRESDMFNRSPQNSPARSTFPTVRSEVSLGV